jgi:hypothetical protein
LGAAHIGGTKLVARQKDTQTEKEKEKEKEREANLGGASRERPSAHEFDECVQYTIAAWPPCRLTKNWYGQRFSWLRMSKKKTASLQVD